MGREYNSFSRVLRSVRSDPSLVFTVLRAKGVDISRVDCDCALCAKTQRGRLVVGKDSKQKEIYDV